MKDLPKLELKKRKKWQNYALRKKKPKQDFIRINKMPWNSSESSKSNV